MEIWRGRGIAVAVLRGLTSEGRCELGRGGALLGEKRVNASTSVCQGLRKREQEGPCKGRMLRIVTSRPQC